VLVSGLQLLSNVSADDLQWYLTSPDGKIASIVNTKFARDRGNMVDEAEIFEREKLRGWGWVDIKIWEWKNSSLLPTFNIRLDLRCPKQVRLLWSYGSLFLGWHVHVWTTTVMLGAISATSRSDWSSKYIRM
jgi:hypothetical protein